MITVNDLKNRDNFFLMAGPCAIEGEDIALRIAEKVVGITNKLNIPYIFKGSYRKANRSRLDSFTGIGDEKALKILRRVGDTFGIPTVTEFTEEYLKFLPENPFIACGIDSLKSEIIKYIENIDLLKDVSFNGRQWVEKYHSYESVNAKLEQLYSENNI